MVMTCRMLMLEVEVEELGGGAVADHIVIRLVEPTSVTYIRQREVCICKYAWLHCNASNRDRWQVAIANMSVSKQGDSTE